MHLLVIDGNNILHAAAHAMPLLSTNDGTPTGAVFGTWNTIEATCRALSPDMLLVAFDDWRSSRRHGLFPGYKRSRRLKQAEDGDYQDVCRQRDIAIELLRALGVAVVVPDGEEADDVLASAAYKARALREADVPLRVTCVTSDKDCGVVLSYGATLWRPDRNERVTAAYIEKKFAVEPWQLPDLQALCGDATDDIPGVAGVGATIAARWLALTPEKSLEALVALVMGDTKTYKGKRFDALRDAHTSGELSLWQQLVALRTDLSLAARLSDLRLPVTLDDPTTALALCQTLQFNALGLRLRSDPAHPLFTKRRRT